MGDLGGMMGGGYLWGALVLILLTAGVAGIAAVLVVATRGQRTQTPPTPRLGEEARDILRRRYAAGDIDEDEYLRRLSGLDQR